MTKVASRPHISPSPNCSNLCSFFRVTMKKILIQSNPSVVPDPQRQASGFIETQNLYPNWKYLFRKWKQSEIFYALGAPLKEVILFRSNPLWAHSASFDGPTSSFPDFFVSELVLPRGNIFNRLIKKKEKKKKENDTIFQFFSSCGSQLYTHSLKCT